MATSTKVKIPNSPAELIKELPEECTTCHRRFKTPQALALHRNRAHGRAAKRGNRAGLKKDHATLDGTALLEKVFPDGIPANAELLARARDWLEEAEQLHYAGYLKRKK